MSKQISLFNFFTKSPVPNKKETSQSNDSKTPLKTPKSSKKNDSAKKSSKKLKETPPDKENINVNKKARKRIIQDDSEEDELSPKKLKVDPISSGESEDEYVPDAAEESSESDAGDDVDSDEPGTPSSTDESPVVKKRKRGDGPKHKKQKVLAKSVPSSPSGGKSNQSAPDVDPSGANWTFLKLDFLKEEKIRDAQRRRPSDPDYDPRTLYVPQDFLQSQTPGMRQWWELKSKNYDCVLFFKVGKFYEFYHMDAVLGVKELNLTFMRGEYAHCGFPETAFGRFSSSLIDKGYKVARVEQTETPEMVTERCKNMTRTKPTKFDRVVKREICQVTSKGTQVYSVLDGQCKEHNNKYLLALIEKEIDAVRTMYGVCFVDTSIGIFHVGQFEDDQHSSRLRTLIATHTPVLLLLERGKVTSKTNTVLTQCCPSAIKEMLAPRTEFLPPSSAVSALAEGNYFPDNKFPPELQSFLGSPEGDNLHFSEDCELGLSCLGAVVWLLKKSLIDHQLLSMSLFKIYEPVDAASSQVKSSQNFNRYMVLDGITLRNLNILNNGAGGMEGSLLHTLNHCQTPFGKRLLASWLSAPLTNPEAISERQIAVSTLRNNVELMKDARAELTTLPDLERLLARIHAGSTNGLPSSHPSTRAIMFEEKVYSKKKIGEFISILNGFQNVLKIVNLFSDEEVKKSSLLSMITQTAPEGSFPANLQEHLDFFKRAFDHEKAESEGLLLPNGRGVDPDYDGALDKLSDLDQELKDYLKEQCQYFGTKVSYVGTAKNRFQLEVPESCAKKASSNTYTMCGQRKGFKRYSTSTTKELLERQIAAEEEKTNVLQNLCQRIFSRFTDHFDDWKQAMECVSMLDVLLSLAEYYLCQDEVMCMPAIKPVEDNEEPYLEIDDGRYPCQIGDKKFISNDTQLGKGKGVMVLTGPNMGGKSTLMRQAALIAILAQIGSGVPAAACRLSPVDRVFTRIGASDDIVAGCSTFYLELAETSSILQHASPHSLILIDELGRGTSTYDGTAIAAAVLKELTEHVNCKRTMFSTHYHSLVDEASHLNITLAHMACLCEDDDEAESVTFLYKVAPGPCPKSYGFNAARLAGLPGTITRRAIQVAKTVQKEASCRAHFRSIIAATNEDELYSAIALL